MDTDRRAEASTRERAEAAFDAMAERVEGRMHDAIGRLPATVRPKLRGWLHLGAIPVSALLCLALLVVADQTDVRAAVAVYTATSLLLFSVSAVYHRGTWGEGMGGFLRRADHANIFLVIAGTYTPYAVLLLPPETSRLLLTLVWSGAGVGVFFRLAWLGAPRWTYVLAYVALGWVAVFFLGDLVRAGGWVVLTFMLAGGLLYTLGAVVYATQKPDPSPRWFGYHEVFHALTIGAWLAFYVGIAVTLARS
jgi:hemolysin III